ncbi:MAG: DEAD/DEAH box helicase [Filimonas sp.]|nr:DEAD/DEAH box helicase [Filimonas sp.]
MKEGTPKQKTIILPAQSKGKNKQTTVTSLLIDVSGKDGNAFKISGLLVIEINGNRNYKVFPLQDELSAFEFKSVPLDVVRIILKLTRDRIASEKQWLTENYLTKETTLSQEAYVTQGLRNYLHDVLQQLRPFNALLKWHYQAVDEMLLTTTFIKPASISNYTPKLSFELVRTDSGVLRLLALVSINNQLYPITDFLRYDFLLRSKNEFFLLQPKDVPALEQFSTGFINVPKQEEAAFIEKVVKPLADLYEVNQEILLDIETIDIEPQCRIHLSELNGSFLMISSKWQYGDFELEDNHEETTSIIADGVRYNIIRRKEKEKEITEFIRGQHARFKQQNNGYFYLSFTEAEKSQWFVKFYRKLSDNNMPVYGMGELKHFRYNTNIPVITITNNSNGIDWFDLKVEISFGDQKVTLADIQKAIINKQPYLLLKDGTLGVIPDDWNNKYGLLLKMGHLQKDTLRLSKLHWTLTQELDNKEELAQSIITEDYRGKWQRMQEKGTSLYNIPAGVNATLRDYQKAGFDWMCLLDEMQWGGCLADDMGLGKTLQTICFLQHLTDKYKKETHLVVAPTSLIYNWESELKKFAPGLTYLIHHGQQRKFDEKEWKKYNLIITSYGSVRSDIEQLATFRFGYIICDESHVIKNPAAQLAKAVLQLQSRNKLILSGTPIQNNTFDLYTQMHFVNQGLLGNREFFKSEFAVPIDKYGSKEQATKLQKLIYPFLLRRTKEQVAKDLPAKTEITLWCEMGEEQRRMYEEVKNYYRHNLLEKIGTEGMGSNTIYILEGLTKLRQLCNAPQLIKDYAGTPANESVKLDELMNEITENTGSHKVLVFSQFTGMLGLISERMNNQGIPFLYLDGSTKATDRQALVNQFQQDENVKVFLISLKAGGVGLTLTAADYVYLVDPWWNPAAEQQAIDRTHRIGQQQKVFAYRMICKDTVEEKIMALQQRKKALADDLISEDSGFIKSLTTEDVDFLFS